MKRLPLSVDALKQPFSKAGYLDLAKELCKDAQFGKEVEIMRPGNLVFEPFQKHINEISRLGKYIDGDGIQLDILVVKAKEPRLLDRARTSLRNVVAEYIKKQSEAAGGDRFRALVAYYADGSPTWRLSYVRYELAPKVEDGKYKVVGEKSPPKRLSFLVGEGEPSHTAQRQLGGLLNAKTPPLLSAIEKAFGVERVTQEFYEQYKALFGNLKEALDAQLKKHTDLRTEFKTKGIQTDAFAKKLLGQIVFLYFLQKKGWLGVEDKQTFGEGLKNFLRSRFENLPKKENYFDDFLKYLFYEALAERRTTDEYPRFNCRIPFLNGGLFEPEKGYDWKNLQLRLPNELFSNTTHTKEGDTGTGILDVFDRYNFTVKEDEPLEREVAVDPEMLGKVFENLLEEEERGASGSFYTPREIVHYMCQQSLLYYLDGQINTPKAIQQLGNPQLKVVGSAAQGGQLSMEQPAGGASIPLEQLQRFVKEASRLEDDTRKTTDADRAWLTKYIYPNAEAIDQALARITVCDPAVGSGAFPVGMMTEIVNARLALIPHLKLSATEKGNHTPYALKRHCIQHSLYGVDIKEEAIDIAKLRLWLSLMVDEESIQTIQPLPNLDYRLVQGNALLDYEIKQAAELGAGGLATTHKLQALKTQLFDTTDGKQKTELRQQLNEELEALTGDPKTFGFAVQFAEVFAPGAAGFDVLVANPPYVRQERIKDQKPELKSRYPDVFTGTADLLVYFFAKGLHLLKPGGVLALITSNKWMRSGYGSKLRQTLKAQVAVQELIDFGDLPVFQAIAYPAILVGKRAKPTGAFKGMTVEGLEELSAFEETFRHKHISITQTSLDDMGWRIENETEAALLAKIRENSIPLKEYVNGRMYRGVLTGLNEAFVVDEATKNALIAADPRSAEVLKPYLRGRDIKRYHIEDPKLWLIFTRRGIDIDRYRAIKAHLLKWRVELEPQPDVEFKNWDKVEDWVNKLKPSPSSYWKADRTKKEVKWPGRKGGTYQWYEIQDNIAYHDEFNVTKIICPDISVGCSFAIDKSGAFVANTAYIFPVDDLFLLGVLNSRIVEWSYRKMSSSIRGGYMRFIATYLENIPIPKCDTNLREEISSLVKMHLKHSTSLNHSDLDDLVLKSFKIDNTSGMNLL